MIEFVVALVATLLVCFGTGGGIAYVRHRRAIHKPDYSHIASLERELGITLPAEAKPHVAASNLRVGPGHVIEVQETNYVQHYCASSYSPE